MKASYTIHTVKVVSGWVETQEQGNDILYYDDDGEVVGIVTSTFGNYVVKIGLLSAVFQTRDCAEAFLLGVLAGFHEPGKVNA